MSKLESISLKQAIPVPVSGRDLNTCADPDCPNYDVSEMRATTRPFCWRPSRSSQPTRLRTCRAARSRNFCIGSSSRPGQLFITDRFGKKVYPREWFYVLPNHVGRAAKLIQDGTLHLYSYDPTTQAIITK